MYDISKRGKPVKILSGATKALKERGWYPSYSNENFDGKLGEFDFEYGNENQGDHHIAVSFNSFQDDSIGFPPEFISYYHD